MKKILDLILDILFPCFCLSCQKEGCLLCPDCCSLLSVCQDNFCLCKNPKKLISPGKCKACQSKKLNGLFFALSYDQALAKKLITKLKYPPYLKDLSKILCDLIITHFNLSNNKLNFSDFILIPVPLFQKKLKQRGFNQSEKIAEQLGLALNIPLIKNVLLKIKQTRSQTELSENQRKENVKGAFLVKKKERAAGKKILLVDDVYTTGATMQECAKALKASGAKQVWGLAAARG